MFKRTALSLAAAAFVVLPGQMAELVIARALVAQRIKDRAQRRGAGFLKPDTEYLAFARHNLPVMGSGPYAIPARANA